MGHLVLVILYSGLSDMQDGWILHTRQSAFLTFTGPCIMIFL